MRRTTSLRLHIVDHPLVADRMALLRSESTSSSEFRAAASEISGWVFYEMSRHLRTKPVTIKTPLQKCRANVISSNVVLIPVLRAGLGMLQGIWPHVPDAIVGHMGLFRDEKSLRPQSYYAKFPPLTKDAHVFILDPMLATGRSAAAAVTEVKKRGAKHIFFACILASPEGVREMASSHPDVPIYTAALDKKLNEKGYILPGLGDAGDRLFGT